jgi:hypothetical protein
MNQSLTLWPVTLTRTLGSRRWRLRCWTMSDRPESNRGTQSSLLSTMRQDGADLAPIGKKPVVHNNDPTARSSHKIHDPLDGVVQHDTSQKAFSPGLVAVRRPTPRAGNPDPSSMHNSETRPTTAANQASSIPHATRVTPLAPSRRRTAASFSSAKASITGRAIGQPCRRGSFVVATERSDHRGDVSQAGAKAVRWRPTQATTRGLRLPRATTSVSMATMSASRQGLSLPIAVREQNGAGGPGGSDDLAW